MINVLEKSLGLARGSVSISHGSTSSRKIILSNDNDKQVVETKLAELREKRPQHLKTKQVILNHYVTEYL